MSYPCSIHSSIFINKYLISNTFHNSTIAPRSMNIPTTVKIAPSSTSPTSALAASPTPIMESTLHKILLTENGDITTASGTPILKDVCSPDVSVRSDDNDLILSVSSPSGPTPSLDVFLGHIASKEYLALGRTSLWWMTPYWSSSEGPLASVPPETQFLLLHLQDDSYALLLPLIDARTFRATLCTGKHCTSRNNSKHDANSSLLMVIESGNKDVTADYFANTLYIGAGSDPYDLIARGVAIAASLSGTAKPRHSKVVPPIVETFSWCTWDAFYSSISADGLHRGLASLVEGGTPPRGVIIDDGWQATDVDLVYRSNKKNAAKTKQTPSTQPAAVQQHFSEQVEVAAVEFLAGPGDQGPEMLKGELELRSHFQSKQEENEREDEMRNVPTTKSILWALQSALIKVVSGVESLLLHLGKNILESSHSDSYFIRGFAALANGPLKPSLLRFYAQVTDHTRRLTSIQANAKFATPESTSDGVGLSDPGGDLASVVASIKSRYGVKYVYAWHALGGFWGGLSQTDPEVRKYSPELLLPTPSPSILQVDPTVSWVQPTLSGLSIPLDPAPLHTDMHAYLQSCGVDGVKVDVQSTIGLAGSASSLHGGPSLAAIYNTSLESSVETHFPNNQLINCMCHSTENLYNFSKSNLARVSDDFYPRRPASHVSHIANCAYNTIFMGELALPDYDMFHSKHAAAELHAAARAVSGGPVYVSDAPGHHDFEILKRLVLPNGRVLRALLPGRPTIDCLFKDVSGDKTTLLKIWNVNAVSGVVGVFNVQGSSFSRRHRAFKTHDLNPPTLETTVHPYDVCTFKAMKESHKPYSSSLYLLYSNRSKSMVVVDVDCQRNGRDAQDDSRCDGLKVRIEPNGGCDIITIAPVLCSTTPTGLMFAPIGLVNMMNSGGAVLSSDLIQDTSNSGSSFKAVVKLRGTGSFAAMSSHRPVSVTLKKERSKGQEHEVDFDFHHEEKKVQFDISCHNDDNDDDEELIVVLAFQL